MPETEQPQPAPVSDRRLQGKVAVITGASSGIGESTARELARLGAHVVLAARRFDALERIAHNIEAADGTAHPLITDTTKPDDLKRMVQTALDTATADLIMLSITLGSAAAALSWTSRSRTSTTLWRRTSAGYSWPCKPKSPPSCRAGVVRSSTWRAWGGIVGAPGISSYVASKHAIIGLTKSVALEYATQNIRINAIAPDATETEIFNHAPQEFKEQLASYTAMKRLAEPIEIARGIVYLLADATFSTGMVLLADGGQSAS